MGKNKPSSRPTTTEAELELVPGDIIKVRDQSAIVEVEKVVDEIEGHEAYIRGWELEGPTRARRKTRFRAIAWRRIERKVEA